MEVYRIPWTEETLWVFSLEYSCFVAKDLSDFLFLAIWLLNGLIPNNEFIWWCLSSKDIDALPSSALLVLGVIGGEDEKWVEEWWELWELCEEGGWSSLLFSSSPSIILPSLLPFSLWAQINQDPKKTRSGDPFVWLR